MSGPVARGSRFLSHPLRMFDGMAASIVIGLLVGVAVGAVVAVVLAGRQREHAQALLAQLREQSASERDAAVRAALDSVVAVADQRLGASQQAGVLALDARKDLIDQRLDVMAQHLTRVTDLVADLERDRERKFGELTSQLQATATATARLGDTAASLREALASPKARGAWGERMAEDVLRLAGFVEGVNYRKQRTLEGGSRPDFTFTLPKGQVVHMDAKFPVASYLRFLECATDDERERHRTQFLRDVRLRVKELSTRDYVDPSGGTVDYVLCFIPNESVYGFIHESDCTLMDDALRQKVVFCSPLSLFAVLAVIRQAFDNFVMEQTGNEILSLLGAFAGQYEKFCDQLEKLGRGLDTVTRAYGDLNGTRRRALERPLEKLEELRTERGLDAAAGHTEGLDIAPLTQRRAAG